MGSFVMTSLTRAFQLVLCSTHIQDFNISTTSGLQISKG